VRNTYYRLGKIFVYKLKVKDAIEHFRFAEKIAKKTLGSDLLIYSARIEGLIKEASIKSYTQRNKGALNEAEKASEACLEITEKIVGDKANYLTAKALLHKGDILL